MKKFESRVLEVKDFSPLLKIIKIKNPIDFEFVPGQFISVLITDSKGFTRRSYSIASLPGEDYIELCIKKSEGGRGSSFFWNLKKGDNIKFVGPLGNFCVKDKKKDLFFISAGTGFAPFKSMILDLIKSGFKRKIYLILGFRDKKSIIYKNFINNMKKSGVSVDIVLSRDKNYNNKGYVQDYLDRLVPKRFKGDFYVCGPGEMMESVKEKLLLLNVSEDRIYFDKW